MSTIKFNENWKPGDPGPVPEQLTPAQNKALGEWMAQESKEIGEAAVRNLNYWATHPDEPRKLK